MISSPLFGYLMGSAHRLVCFFAWVSTHYCSFFFFLLASRVPLPTRIPNPLTKNIVLFYHFPMWVPQFSSSFFFLKSFLSFFFFPLASHSSLSSFREIILSSPSPLLLVILLPAPCPIGYIELDPFSPFSWTWPKWLPKEQFCVLFLSVYSEL